MKQFSKSMSAQNCLKIKIIKNRRVEALKTYKKWYNAKAYGTSAPNVIQPIRDGDSGKKKSNLKSQIPNEVKQ